MQRRFKVRSGGFTLVEIIVVVIIIGLLATMIVPKLVARVGKTKRAVAQHKVSVIEGAVEMFRLDYGRYPENLEELLTRPSDVPEGKWTLPTIKSKDLIDPWDRPFVYEYPGDHDGAFDLSSLGADGQEGGEHEDEDIVNWSKR